MRTLDNLETDTGVVDAPDEPRETVESPRGEVLDDADRRRDSLETDTRVVDASDAPREIPETENMAESPRGQVLDDPERRREESAESRQRVEGDWDERPFKVDREELGRFDLKRAGLPDMSIESAAKYIEEHRASRPWLAMADRACPETRRIIAALDAAGGHAHIRHEGWVTEEANRRRVSHREDPAQLDPEKRELSIDGLRPNDPLHNCRTTATRITDPDAFATAFVRGVAHPKVREALDKPTGSSKWPGEVAIPISDLLGPDYYRLCKGWRLDPGDGSMKAAVGKRDDWVEKRADGCKPDVPAPRAAPVPTFSGGDIVFAFAPDHSEKRYGVVTMFPRPAHQQPDVPLENQIKEQRDGTVLLGASSERPVCHAHRDRDDLPRPRELPS
jgi:hypothetical protein